ncbi:head-tail connector protein [Parasporobacterium paucivorans]|uniref:Phage gp6-like head-tail connector protein n=1 Tax=Parasporobacterium paucivorans DSM 15970 TaxID=1122934 RepID=A0A1M6B2A2_9FIRM|nr:hypothetical protein [Parasporobacterium paucivorans]SHI42872.1 hypothetical protein SAMN02745691_00241 [Parasporobacterium paucivorans DSM 15970]
MAFIDYEYYFTTYGGSIPEAVFSKWARKAENRLNMRTLGNIIITASYAESVKLCACEIADILYQYESLKGASGMILKSYSNDGESGTFNDAEMTEDAVNSRIEAVMIEYLYDTNLLYRGF